MKMLFTENWFIKSRLSHPSRVAVGWEDIVDNAQFLMFSFDSARAGPQRTTSFFFSRWECAAFFGHSGGREYSNSMNVVKGSVDNSQKGAQLLVNSLCSFEVTLLHFKVTLLQDSTYIVQVPLPVFCARFPLNVGLPPRKECPPSGARVWLQKVGRGTITWSPALRGKVRRQSAQTIHFKFRAGGWKVFWGRGKFRYSTGNKTYYSGRERKFQGSHDHAHMTLIFVGYT